MERIFLRVNDIIQMLGISRSTWWRWVRAGKAPQPIHLSPRCTVWRAEDIQKWVNAPDEWRKKED
ncbi:MAG: AlpA family phage regulatory protein [Zetaproteobacteria bacterium]|nr:MAG: AlpA family phage regulatory protein [Zetaproteobacteria bacterium]